jgi:NAD-dependent deacetylase
MKIVVLTGAGISQESGIQTFRDSNGLWENHDVHEVAHPDGWENNKTLVNRFYNARRKQLLECVPNAAHLALVELEKHHDVTIITQNVDDLHERAGSTDVVHLHGELLKVRDEVTGDVYDWTSDLADEDLSPNENTLRPHIVWFTENVPNIIVADRICKQADIIMIIGTSLEVYPAADLYRSAPLESEIHVFNMEKTFIMDYKKQFQHIGKAGTTVPAFVSTLI